LRSRSRDARHRAGMRSGTSPIVAGAREVATKFRSGGSSDPVERY
jgi:hypothetical protein